jgi:hypothetical protein
MPAFISDKQHLALSIALGDLPEPFQVCALLSKLERKVLVLGAFVRSRFHGLILSLGLSIIAL